MTIIIIIIIIYIIITIIIINIIIVISIIIVINCKAAQCVGVSALSSQPRSPGFESQFRQW